MEAAGRTIEANEEEEVSTGLYSTLAAAPLFVFVAATIFSGKGFLGVTEGRKKTAERYMQ